MVALYSQPVDIISGFKQPSSVGWHFPTSDKWERGKEDKQFLNWTQELHAALLPGWLPLDKKESRGHTHLQLRL